LVTATSTPETNRPGPPRILGLIPARGGSKRLPRKNVLPLAGRPLIAWSIRAGLASRHITDLVVSTDDAEIADIAHRHGATVPFMRPPELASDTASSLDVMLHALHALAERGQYYDYLVELQPTSPLRSGADIDAAIELARQRRADAVISVCRTDHPPEWSNTLPDDHALRDFFRPGVRETRSQDLPVSYRLNGAIYLFDCQRLLRTRSLDMDDKAYAYIMPRERSIDIDTALDLHIAEAILQHAAEAPA
jgi:CMP-N-acetylneuraminic acid synthetase